MEYLYVIIWLMLRKKQSAPVFHSPACKKSLYNHNYAKQTVLNKDTSN